MDRLPQVAIHKLNKTATFSFIFQGLYGSLSPDNRLLGSTLKVCPREIGDFFGFNFLNTQYIQDLRGILVFIQMLL